MSPPATASGVRGSAAAGLLELSNVEARYGPVNAVRGVSLRVEEGEITAILGANGAGKTTILRAISGLLTPDKGSIVFRGERIDGLRPDLVVWKGIAHVPQGREVFPDLTVADNLRMGAFVRRDGGGVAADVERVYGYFPVLRDRATQRAGTLSGGEQQMLAIARAVLSRPQLLLLDEPSLGLSPKLVQEIFRVIRGINEEGTAILLVEQNARAALGVASYGYVLETGRVVLDGPAARLMADEDVKEFYLGVAASSSPKGYRRWRRRKKW